MAANKPYGDNKRKRRSQTKISSGYWIQLDVETDKIIGVKANGTSF